MSKENPNDATFRNINALKKRVVVLERIFGSIAKSVAKKVKRVKK